MRAWWAVTGVVLVIAVPVALSISRGREPKRVELEVATTRVISPLILASGTLSYQSEVRLVPEVIARVVKVNVKEGDRVSQGDLLVQLDPATAQAQIAQQEAASGQAQLDIEHQRVALEFQTAKWKRYQTMVREALTDRQTYEEITSQRDLAQVELNLSLEKSRQAAAQLKEAREQLAKTEIRAPISGEVTAIYIKAGETAVPSALSIAGSDLMVLASTANMFAEVNVDEADVARVAVGQRASIVPAAFVDQSWKGIVEQVSISPTTQAGQNKTYMVRIRLQDRPAHFRPGMSCRAEIATRAAESAATLAVPVQAVVYEDSDDYTRQADQASVYILRGTTALKRHVETGTADDAYTEIVKGIRSGDQVVTGPAKVLRFLRDGDEIRGMDAEVSGSGEHR
jgi:HlyD family secretion protein